MKESVRSPRFWFRLHAWLSSAEMPRPADVIFVLAGKMQRKEYALQLLRQGLAPKALFSVGRFEIRRFSKMPLPVPYDLLQIAQSVAPPQRHYFVFFAGQAVETEHVPPGRFGTLTEIRALARWLASRPEIRSLLIVSTDWHLRRIRMCCRALLNPALDLTYLAVPADESPDSLFAPASSDTPPHQHPGRGAPPMRMDELRELFKVLFYWVLLKFRRG